jgi:predicted DNA-binding transcriptional regulator AlpA
MITGNNLKGKIASEGSVSYPFIGRGLNRTKAAYFFGISPTMFDEFVKAGEIPKPIRLKSRVIWDRQDLEEAFEDFKEKQVNNNNPWDILKTGTE